jgi:hypothetical protein
MLGAESWVREAVAGGAKLLCGGGRQGSMMEPTLLTGTQSHMKVNCEYVKRGTPGRAAREKPCCRAEQPIQKLDEIF